MVKKKFGKAAMTFSEKVLALALMVPPGRVTTYGDIARAAGGGGMAARSVTGILGKTWDKGEKKIPFHRIVYAGGRAWVNEENREKRMKLYKKEGIEIDSRDRVKDFEELLFDFRNN